MSCHLCHLLWSDAVQWDEILWVCDAMWLVAMSRCVVRSGRVGWIGRWPGDPYYTDLLRTTQYYKVLLRYYSVLHSTTPVLLRTTRYHTSTTPYYKVLLQYYSVLQSTTPVLVCTTKYYSSTILYYTVLLQYYSVRTTPVLILYYKVLLQYYSVLHRSTPVQLCTTLYYKVLQSTTPVLLLVLQSTHLQCAEQQDSSSNITKCCACHAKWLASSILVTYKTLFTMRGGTGITRQPHQILRLPRKMTLMIDLHHIWNDIYNARSNRHHPPTSPNTAPATQNDSHDWCPSHMTRHLQCAEQQISSSNITKCCACHAKWLASSILVTYKTLFTMRGGTGITRQPHQILRLPRKMTLMIDLRHIWNVIYNAQSNKHHPPTSPNTAPATQNCIPKSKRNCPKTVEVSFTMRGRFEHDPNPIRTRSEHDLVISHPPVRRGYFSHFGDTFCIENYIISRSGYLPRFHQILRLPQKVTLQDHQRLRLPRKMILMIDVRHIWNVTYNARNNKHHLPSSPNAAPAT